MSEELLASPEVASPLAGSSRACSAVVGDREFYEETENCGGFIRHHLVDDKWYRCRQFDGSSRESSDDSAPACPICLSDQEIREHSSGLVGRVLTIIDATGSFNEKQAKAVKDLIMNAIHDEGDSLELEVRRIIAMSIPMQEKSA